MKAITLVHIPSAYPELASDSFDGLTEVVHLDSSDDSLPVQVSLLTPETSHQQQLDRLFLRGSISEVIVQRLRPVVVNPGIFCTSQFRDSLLACQASLQQMALQHPADAKIFGRLGRLLREKDALLRLAKMYSSALLQG